MNLNRTGSIWNRENRNGINQNWGEIEDGLNTLISFTEGFDGSKLLERTANLFNKNEAGYGAVHSASGEVRNPDDGFRNTGFIKVDPRTTYRMNQTMGLGAQYDGNFNYVAPISTSGDTIHTHANTRYVMVSVSAARLDTTMFYKGSEYKSYEPYGFRPSQLTASNALTINRGADFPLLPNGWNKQNSGTINEVAKNAILDAEVFGAIPGRIYRLAFVANGHLRDDVPHYGITIQEEDLNTGAIRIVNNYITDAGVKRSNGIDTITQGNDEMMFSVTVDRKVISDSSTPLFLNMNHSPAAYIDPNRYSF